MKKKITRACLVPFLLSFAAAIGAPRARPENGLTPFTDLEKFLREAKVLSVTKEVSPGRSRPWIVILSEGGVQRQALFKYFDYRRPQPQPHSYKYELAAYALDRLLDAQLVPPVVERKIEGRKGSLQIFLENCVSEQDRRRKRLEPPDPKAFANAVEGARVFESLADDECLNYSDLLVHTDDWRVCRVDFSEAFAPSPELRPDCRITVCPRRLYEGLQKLDDATLVAAMKAYLNEAEIRALLARKSLILDKIKALIAEKGEASVLF
jgi:hypothetical protein